VKRASFWSAPLPWGPVAAGFVARIAFIAWTSPLALSWDEERFWSLAGSRLAGTAFIPPLYPAFLATVRAILGDDILRVRLLQALLCLLSILLVHDLAGRHMGRGEGRWPAWVMALSPTLVYWDGRLRSESLVILLLLGFTWLWTAPAKDDRRSPLAAGALLGLATLGRPECLLLPALLAALAWRRAGGRAAVLRAGLLLPGMLLLLLPWAARNAAVVGVWTPVSTNAGYNFWKSFNEATDGSQIPLADGGALQGVAEGDLDARGFRLGWDFIAAHPWRSLLLVPAKWGHLFGPERDLLSDIRRRHYPIRALPLDIAVAIAMNLAWAALLALGLYALIGPMRSDVKDAAIAVLLMLLVTHAVFFGDDRFHVPLLPFLCVALPEAWAGGERPRGRVGLLAMALLVEAVFWIAILARDVDRLRALAGGA